MGTSALIKFNNFLDPHPTSVSTGTDFIIYDDCFTFITQTNSFSILIWSSSSYFPGPPFPTHKSAFNQPNSLLTQPILTSLTLILIPRLF